MRTRYLRALSLICTQIFSDTADSFSYLRNQCNLRTIFRGLFYFCLLLLFGFQPVSAQTSTPQVSVTISVLDANGQPVTGIRVELVIFQYDTSVEPFPAGGCETDEAGSCVILTNLPPSSGDWYEGVVYVSDLGRQLVGWQGTETLIVIQLAEDGRLPTEEPHLEGPYTGQENTPTESIPGIVPTETPGFPVEILATRTNIPTKTDTPHPTTPITPTLTSTLVVTPTLFPSPAQRESAIVVWIIGGFLLVGVGLWLFLRRRKKQHG